MTYDERQEIDLYLAIVETNVKRLERSIETLKATLDKIPCQTKNESKTE